MDNLIRVGAALSDHSVTVVQYLAVLWYMWFGLMAVFFAVGVACVVWLATRPA